MTFGQSIKTCLREKYITFSGRASRSEYWWFQLFFFLILFVLGLVVGGFLGFISPSSVLTSNGFGGFGIVFGIAMLALYIPSISVLVRRFHDRGVSGWWVLAVMIGTNIPYYYIGVVIAFGTLVFLVLKGTEGPNRFGPDPLNPHGGVEVFE